VTAPVAVFGVAPKTRQQTDLTDDVSGATPETARKMRALPQSSNRKIYRKSVFDPWFLPHSFRFVAAGRG